MPRAQTGHGHKPASGNRGIAKPRPPALRKGWHDLKGNRNGGGCDPCRGYALIFQLVIASLEQLVIDPVPHAAGCRPIGLIRQQPPAQGVITRLVILDNGQINRDAKGGDNWGRRLLIPHCGHARRAALGVNFAGVEQGKPVDPTNRDGPVVQNGAGVKVELCALQPVRGAEYVDLVRRQIKPRQTVVRGQPQITKATRQHLVNRLVRQTIGPADLPDGGHIAVQQNDPALRANIQRIARRALPDRAHVVVGQHIKAGYGGEIAGVRVPTA